MSDNALTSVQLKNFTAFSDLKLKFSSGINVVIGANSTGKTHLLQLLYSACAVTRRHETWQQKLTEVFLPSRGEIGRLVARGKNVAEIKVLAKHAAIGNAILRNRKMPRVLRGAEDLWYEIPLECAFIPANNLLANAPGFLSVWDRRELSFEAVYPDILRLAYLPPLKSKELTRRVKGLLRRLEGSMGGEVVRKGEEFFRQSDDWELEFSLLAAGYRKLGLLWLLIRNGTIGKDSLLFWDEPETNLNPQIIGHVVDLLLDLQRIGVQVFVATHSYVFVKEMDLRMKSTDRVRFFSLYRHERSGEIASQAADEFASIDPNLIADTLVDLYDRDVDRVFKTGGSK